jgi:hypothetical protein
MERLPLKVVRHGKEEIVLYKKYQAYYSVGIYIAQREE